MAKRNHKTRIFITTYLILGFGLTLFSQSTEMTPYFTGGLNPIAPLSEGWDFSVSRHYSKWSATLIYRGGFQAEEDEPLLNQMFEQYDNVRVNIDQTLILNLRYHFSNQLGINKELYTGGLLAYETWTIQSRATTSLGEEVENGNPYAGFNLGYIWYPSFRKKATPRFFIDAYLHFIWKLDESEEQTVGDQTYMLRPFAVTFFPTIHLGYRF